MPAKNPLMVIDKPNFTVKLHDNLLEVDLKKGARKELEDALEATSAFRGSLGFLFQNAIPLDVPLKDIESVEKDEKGQVKVVIPHRKDITIQLEPTEAKKLVGKLNELIPLAKRKEIERVLASYRGKKAIVGERTAVRRAEAGYVASRERD